MDKRKRLKLALADACASGAVEQIISLNPASLGLDTSCGCGSRRRRLQEKSQEEEDELDAIFIQGASLSCSLALTSDAGWWVKPKVPAWFDKFLAEVNDRDSWFNELRMSKDTFLWICKELQPLLNKQVTKFRYPIPVPCRLGAALYRLISGADLQVISQKFGIGVSSSQTCITDTIKAINEHFSGCLRYPRRSMELREVVTGFNDRCELLNCAGAIGTTNIQVMASTGLDIVDSAISLQGVCDTGYRFLDISCGSPQDVIDSVYPSLQKTKDLFFASMDTAQMGMQYYLVGDSRYPLLSWLLVPYQSSESEMRFMAASFNKRHALGTAHVRQAFVILKDTFGILQKCVKHNVAFVPKLVTACCILHNILLDRGEVLLDNLPYTDASPLDSQSSNISEYEGQEYRDHLAEVFFHRDL